MYLNNNLSLSSEKELQLKEDGDIAIIGMACRFPGADNYEEFWGNLINEKDCITEIPINRWDWRKYYGDPQKEPNKTDSKWGGFINDVEKFDAAFFKISPREAEQMDPQQRILLEETWHCIEDSGVPITTLQNKKTAVLVGTATNDYHLLSADPNNIIDTYSGLGNYKSVFSNRISFFFGFNGPSSTIDAACASSLVTIYEAKQKLNNRECDFAIVAGSNLILHPYRYISFAKSRMLSKDGRCKTFDHAANGYVPGEGIGVLLLCRKGYAIKEGKRIYGVIKGAAINHSGELTTITAPKVMAQKNVIISALEDGGINPLNVSYVEAHGTGTSLGDPIEVEALRQAYRSYTDEKEFCYIGSVKSNIGHLEGASGIAGIIKVLLMMQAKEIPETINLTHPNPLINFKETPFVLAQMRRAWESRFTKKLIAGISSFGFSGVNAHVIIENYDLEVQETYEPETYVFGLSAKSKSSLDKLVESWKRFIYKHDFLPKDINFISSCCMANRMRFQNRMGGIVCNESDMIKLLNDYPKDNNKIMEWHLHIGDFLLSGITDVDSSIIKDAVFKEGIEIFLEKVVAEEKEKWLENLYKSQWDESHSEVLTLIVVCAYIHLLKIAGVNFKQISGNGKGIFSALIVSGIIEFNDYYQIKEGFMKWSEIEIKRPNMPFYDLDSKNFIYPVQITPKYLRYLLSEDSLDDEDLNFYINKAKDLMQYQFTFKKLISEWDNVTEGKITKFLKNKPETKVDRDLLSIAIISSLERINKKWTLSNSCRPICKAINEWVQLIVKGFITEKEFIALIDISELDVNALCENITIRMMGNNNICNDDFPILYESFNTFHKDWDLEIWINKQETAQSFCYLNHTNINCFMIKDESNDENAKNLFSCNLNLELKKVLYTFWINGQNINWELLNYKGCELNSLILPEYQFNKNSFWMPDIKENNDNLKNIYLHPLVQKNTSRFNEQRFSSEFNGKEFFLTDHRVKNKKVLPGVAYLEMVRAAATLSTKEKVVEINNIIWSQPIIVEEDSRTVSVALYPKSDFISYEIYNGDSEDDKKTVYSQGKVKISSDVPKTVEKINIDEISRLCHIEFDKEKCYKSFHSIGLNYGPSFQTIETLKTDGVQVLAKLKLPESIKDTSDSFEMHPSLFDGALQSVMGLTLGESELPSLKLPYAMDRLQIFKKIQEIAFVLVKKQDSKNPRSSFEKYDIKITDKDGIVVLAIQGFSMLNVYTMEGDKNNLSQSSSSVLYARPVWKEKALIVEKGDEVKKVIIFTASMEPEIIDLLKKNYPKYEFEELIYEDETLDGLVNKRFNQVFDYIKKVVMEKVKENHYIVILASDKEPENHYSYLSGMLKSVFIETPRIKGKILTISCEFIKSQPQLLLYELLDTAFESVEVRLSSDKKRLVKIFEEIKVEKERNTSLIKEHGIYLITGGMGGLGLIFAEHFVKTLGATVVLTGRSDLDDYKSQKLMELNQKKGKVVYLQCDINNKSAVEMLIKTVKNKYGNITGIIHSAGVIRDSLIMKKTKEEINDVLGAKITGLVNIDESTQDMHLDFLVLFSSIASIKGNMGQADYASANAFLDEYSVYRNELVKRNLRFGKTISINWPLWKDGGMRIDESSLKLLKSRWGMESLPSKDGIWAFDYLLDVLKGSGLVVYGNFEKTREIFLQPTENETKNIDYKINMDDLDMLKERTIKELMQICEELLKVSALDLDVDMEFSEYGLDSILMMQMLNKIEGKYNEALAPEAVINYPTIAQLATYLIDSNIVKMEAVDKVQKKDHKKDSNNLESLREYTIKELTQICEELLKVSALDLDVDAEFSEYGLDSILMMQMLNKIEGKYNEVLAPEAVINYPTISQLATYLIDNNFVKIQDDTTKQNNTTTMTESIKTYENIVKQQVSYSTIKSKDSERIKVNQSVGFSSKKVAVIGISGRFPKSPNLESFWNNLTAGVELISEVPKERFDIWPYFDSDKGSEGKTYAKWAGFMDQIDQFDAGYFGISDTDALMMDPQHRILLELTQELWDRSGYKKEEVSNRKISVFIGGTESGYHDIYGTNLPNKYMKHYITNSIPNMMAARISDFYNLRGISHTLDTACSSALVAIHQAVRSVQNGESEMAIAGGIQLLIGPKNFIAFSKASVLSDTGKSYVFDKRANGFVLGEGAGLVLLKDYESALSDNDQILAVVLGSAVNNDGHTMGLTTPNPEAQKQVVEMALKEANINPETIELYEAHGTGTLLGDPMEIKAMKEVYGTLTEKRGYCAVGSVKSNTGHLLRAAGVAGFIKLILAMQHNEKPRTINCEIPHPRFKFDESPFYPITSNEPWYGINGIKRAAISSFGFGGTNCHIILESVEKSTTRTVRRSLENTLFSRKIYWLGRELIQMREDNHPIMSKISLNYEKLYGYNDYLLKDHQIYGKRVLIGMAYVAQFYQYMIKNENNKDVFLSRTIFFNPLYMDKDRDILVKTQAVKTDNESLKLECSFQKENGEVVISANTNVDFKEKYGVYPYLVDVVELFNKSEVSLSPSLFYKNSKQNMYSESLFSLKAIKKVKKGLVGEIKLSKEIQDELSDMKLNPAILDAGHNLTLFLDIEDSNEITFKGTWLPLLIKNTAIYTQEILNSTIYCYAEKIKDTSEIKEYNLDFYNSKSRLMVRMEGFVRKRVSDAERFIKESKKIIGEEIQIKEEDIVIPRSMELKQQVENYLKNILITIGNVNPEGILNEMNFLEMGIESSKLIDISGKIERELNIELYPTLFFEYQNLSDLGNYFIENHQEALEAYYNNDLPNTFENIPEIKSKINQLPKYEKIVETIKPLSEVETIKSPVFDDIAIIGMHGYFADSKNMDEFWENLCNQVDLIKEIPIDHFDYRPWFDPIIGTPDKQYNKWGSFINDVDKFDASFFRISPREAELMDPQLRLSLQAMYSAAEDAGYITKLKGSNTGVFVGACFNDYHTENLSNQKIVDPYDGTGNATTMLANRPSFYFNMTGPSLSVDTACSSSLVALHMAIQSLKSGDCDMAFVNGVNLLLSSWHYRYFCSIEALSHTGRCYSFDDAADGYVPGEGIVSILIKPLTKAIRDGDQIHAVIKGSAISHGGYTPSITAPSVTGEAEVIMRAWENAGIDPSRIGYVEAHGTGTKLGDPIEIQALKKAFKNYTDKEQSCAIGTAKAHIGHSEGAAGLAGIVKVVLSMKNKMIPAMPKFKTLNPMIKLEGSPLYINRENKYWEKIGDFPRLAGVSSFGFGGAYAHVVIEELIEPEIVLNEKFPVLIPLSAKKADRLKEHSKNLLHYLKKNIEVSEKKLSINSIAYSLQVGREDMDFRVAFIVNSREELIEKLNAFVEGKADINNVFSGEVKDDNTIVHLFKEDEFLKRAVDKWIENNHIVKLAELWVKGGNIDWNLLYSQTSKPMRISVPTYPFAKERYWISCDDIKKQNIPKAINISQSYEQTTSEIQEVKELDFKEIVERDVKQIAHEVLKISLDQLDNETLLSEFGFDSISLSIFANRISKLYGLNITPATLFGYPSIGETVMYLINEHREVIQNFYKLGYEKKDENFHKLSNSSLPTAKAEYVEINDSTSEPIAIIGMSCKFPMAKDSDEFWENLIQGRDCITEIPLERWDWKTFYGEPEKNKKVTNIKWGGFIDGVGDFDPDFFGISPEDARLIDPNQRIMLTYVYKALEDAGYDPKSLAGSNTGVFIGVGNSDYNSLFNNTSINSVGTNMLSSIGPNRISYFLDLHGPSEPIESACASSLIAIRRGIMSINNGNCDMAIVGGVNSILTPEGHIALSNDGVLSNSGKCKPFSVDADGFVRSEGVGVLILKKLSSAEKDGDNIYGVIRGSAENHGGRSNFLTAPNPIAQAELFEKAYQEANIDPSTVTYIEAHGTGTLLGDNIEMDSLKNAFKNLYNAAGNTMTQKWEIARCGIGSVKSNIGHTELASGMASVIKVLLQLKHQALVPTINCREISPYIQLDNTPFYIVKEKQPWNTIYNSFNKPIPRRAGISAFGLGGVNAHIIIEEYIKPEKVDLISLDKPQLVIFSAQNQECLEQVVSRMLEFIKRNSNININDLAYTLQVGREHQKLRLAMVVSTKEELIIALEDYLNLKKASKIRLITKESLKLEFLNIIESFSTQTKKDLINELVTGNDLEKLGVYWVQGNNISWSLFNKNNSAKRISLPTYAFKENYYWIEDASKYSKSLEIDGGLIAVAKITDDENHVGKKYNKSELFKNWF